MEDEGHLLRTLHEGTCSGRSHALLGLLSLIMRGARLRSPLRVYFQAAEALLHSHKASAQGRCRAALLLWLLSSLSPNTRLAVTRRLEHWQSKVLQRLRDRELKRAKHVAAGGPAAGAGGGGEDSEGERLCLVRLGDDCFQRLCLAASSDPSEAVRITCFRLLACLAWHVSPRLVSQALRKRNAHDIRLPILPGDAQTLVHVPGALGQPHSSWVGAFVAGMEDGSVAVRSVAVVAAAACSAVAYMQSRQQGLLEDEEGSEEHRDEWLEEGEVVEVGDYGAQEENVQLAVAAHADASVPSATAASDRVESFLSEAMRFACMCLADPSAQVRVSSLRALHSLLGGVASQTRLEVLGAHVDALMAARGDSSEQVQLEARRTTRWLGIECDGGPSQTASGDSQHWDATQRRDSAFHVLSNVTAQLARMLAPLYDAPASGWLASHACRDALRSCDLVLSSLEAELGATRSSSMELHDLCASLRYAALYARLLASVSECMCLLSASGCDVSPMLRQQASIILSSTSELFCAFDGPHASLWSPYFLDLALLRLFGEALVLSASTASLFLPAEWLECADRTLRLIGEQCGRGGDAPALQVPHRQGTPVSAVPWASFFSSREDLLFPLAHSPLTLVKRRSAHLILSVPEAASCSQRSPMLVWSRNAAGEFVVRVSASLPSFCAGSMPFQARLSCTVLGFGWEDLSRLSFLIDVLPPDSRHRECRYLRVQPAHFTPGARFGEFRLSTTLHLPPLCGDTGNDSTFLGLWSYRVRVGIDDLSFSSSPDCRFVLADERAAAFLWVHVVP